MISSVKEKVQKHMDKDNCGHGFDHIERVYRIALKLLENEKADKEVVMLAALLHDADDYKLFGQEAADNLTNAKRIMSESNVDFEYPIL